MWCEMQNSGGQKAGQLGKFRSPWQPIQYVANLDFDKDTFRQTWYPVASGIWNLLERDNLQISLQILQKYTSP